MRTRTKAELRLRVRAQCGGAIGAGLFVACVATTPVSVGADARQLQCWKDEHGVRACGDHVPPQYARTERDIVDAQGKVVKVLPRERTPEEQAADQRAAEAAKTAAAIERRQHAHDAFLLQSYTGVTAVERARDDSLAAIDGRLQVAERTRGSTETTLADLQQRADGLRAGGKPVPPDLDKSIASFTAARAQTVATITQLHDERQRTADQFDRDIERYRTLRPTPASP